MSKAKKSPNRTFTLENPKPTMKKKPTIFTTLKKEKKCSTTTKSPLPKTASC